MNKITNLLKLFQFYGLKSFIIFLRYFYFKTLQLLGKEALLTKVYNYKMFIPLKYNGIGEFLYLFKQRELDHKWIIEQEVSPNDVILDLGVNIGYYALMEAMQMHGKGKIYAIEPDPRNIEFLEKNISLNKIENLIEFETGAISNKNGEAKFTLSKRTNLNSFALDEKNSESITVPLFDFGDYLKNKDRIDLVRMDIEGHETEVFQSLYNFYQKEPNKLPKKIIFETHLRVYKKSQGSMSKVLQDLFNIGYRIKYLSSANEKTTSLKNLGYKPFKVIKDYPFIRGLYKDVNNEDAINCITNIGGVRTVLLELS